VTERRLRAERYGLAARLEAWRGGGTVLAPSGMSIQGAIAMHEIPKPSESPTPIEEPPQTPEHVPELPPIHDPDPQQEQV
jgi:hypothetical protein